MSRTKSDARGGVIGGSRKRWFRFAALAIPVVLLLVLELGLRLFGYGYPTGYFLKSRIQGRDVVIENPQFTLRFFPPGLERTPQPVAISAVKPADTCRIFLFGESAAMGDPAPAFAFGRILEVLLRAQYPGKKFEVVNVAITAINSHAIREIARDCATRDGDVWLIYTGNNEVIGPFGAGTIFGTRAPNLTFIRASIALKATRTGQAFDALLHRLKKGAPATWGGMEMFLGQQIRQDDPLMASVYQHFEKNLEDILQIGAASGAKVLLSTVASNLKDCPPFASLHRPDLTAAQLAEWDKLFQTATNHEAAQNYSAAVAEYQRAARLDDRYAELHFRLGGCHWVLGHFAEAKKSFELARDLDTLRFRGDTRINQIIQQAASRHGGAGLKFVDAVEVLAQNSPHGVAGEELLYEHVHPNFDGQYLLARTFAEQITGLLPARISAAATNKQPWLSAEECSRRLAYTDWDRYQVVDEVFKRLELPPFSYQLDHAARQRRLVKLRADLQPALRPEGTDAAIAVYRQALALSPDDYALHENFAKLLQTAAEPSAAEAEWRKVLQLMPHHLEAYYSLGNVLDARGKTAEAIAYFRQALQRRPDLVEAQNGLGLALANLGKLADAEHQFEAALRRKPDFAEGHVNLGQILAQQGRVEEAMAEYTLALRYNSNSVAAHINTGKILAGQGKLEEAVTHYQTALRLKPDNAIAHFNLGNALTALGKPDALAHYAEAARLRPDFVEVRYSLALGLAKQGRNAEALMQFEEIVRLKPEFADAHLNLGVALAKERRYDEAVAQFEQTLRLDPGNAAAKRFLDQALALGNRKP